MRGALTGRGTGSQYAYRTGTTARYYSGDDPEASAQVRDRKVPGQVVCVAAAKTGNDDRFKYGKTG